MKNSNLSVFLLLFSTVAFGQGEIPYSYQSGTYMPGRVIFKLLPQHRSALAEMDRATKSYRLSDAKLQQLCTAHGAFSVKLLFPHHLGREAGVVDLSLIGELLFAETVHVPKLCRQLMGTSRFEYVEPRMIYKTAGHPTADLSEILPAMEMLFMPNDPTVGQQWHLGKIKAFDAWDIEQGDTSVLIGIVDSGVDYNHPDLIDNIAKNYADPVNGIDDDGNGFMDDYFGWDFYHKDNDPMPGAIHGTAVAGAAAAVTNNGIGLAAPGFNCRVLAIKASSDDPTDTNITFGYEGIVYAANRGCRIINCSWGGSGPISNYLKTVVRYATLDKNALVVAVAGNEDSNIPFSPSSAEYVLSVAATDASDVKRSYSSFGNFVDISAPANIWATEPGGAYSDGWWGTSFSVPVACGAAAILASYDPSLSAIQLGERLRMTADNIDAQNPNYIEQLGRGRLNMYNSLTGPEVPAVRFTGEVFSDGNDGIPATGDTIRLSGDFVNYLADVTGFGSLQG